MKLSLSMLQLHVCQTADKVVLCAWLNWMNCGGLYWTRSFPPPWVVCQTLTELCELILFIHMQSCMLDYVHYYYYYRQKPNIISLYWPSSICLSTAWRVLLNYPHLYFTLDIVAVTTPAIVAATVVPILVILLIASTVVMVIILFCRRKNLKRTEEVVSMIIYCHGFRFLFCQCLSSFANV